MSLLLSDTMLVDTTFEDVMRSWDSASESAHELVPESDDRLCASDDAHLWSAPWPQSSTRIA